MAIKKEKLVGFLTKEQKEVVERLEELIDRTIRKNYVPCETVTVDLEGYPHERVRKEITKRYKDAGWKIEFKSDRDGNSVALY